MIEIKLLIFVKSMRWIAGELTLFCRPIRFVTHMLFLRCNVNINTHNIIRVVE